jgi:hypothetical protein
MAHDDEHGQPVGEAPELPPWGNCADCGLGYASALLASGVCPRCRMPKMEMRPNPALPENTAAMYHPPNPSAYNIEGIFTLRNGDWNNVRLRRYPDTPAAPPSQPGSEPH